MKFSLADKDLATEISIVDLQYFDYFEVKVLHVSMRFKRILE